MKIHPVGDEFFDADGWTDVTNLSAAFRNFRKRLNTTTGYNFAKYY